MHGSCDHVTARDDELVEDLFLYLVTDSRWLDGRSLADCVAQAIEGGVTFVQLREKSCTTEELLRLAKELLPICHRAHIPFVVNDDVDAALLSGADGVHVGQSDAACADARRKLGPEAIVGVSAQTVEQAIEAQAAGASYLGVGAVFSTSTKSDADAVSKETLAAICDAVDIPVIAIGGIDAGNVGELARTGIAGVAAVSAILAAKDIREAATSLAEATRRIIGE